MPISVKPNLKKYISVSPKKHKAASEKVIFLKSVMEYIEGLIFYPLRILRGKIITVEIWKKDKNENILFKISRTFPVCLSPSPAATPLPSSILLSLSLPPLFKSLSPCLLFLLSLCFSHSRYLSLSLSPFFHLPFFLSFPLLSSLILLETEIHK
jgi:hypothetical protein